MYKVIIFSLIVFSFIFFLTLKNEAGNESLHLGKIIDKSQVENAQEVVPERPLPQQLEEKVALKEVAMTDQEIEQLKLSDFHAYLRHEDRLAKQGDPGSIDSIVSPEVRKELAKERLAVKLIEELSK